MVVGDSLSLVLQVMMRHSVPCMHTCVHAYYMHAHNALNAHNALILSPASCVTSCLYFCLMPYASCTHSHFIVGGRMRRASKPPGRVCTLPWAFVRMQACRHAWAGMRKIWNASRICVSSLRRGHANLLCIVPILVYVSPERTRYSIRIVRILMQEPSLKTLTCGTPQGVRGTPQCVRAEGLWIGFEPCLCHH